jgi:hypothetical protein
LITLTAALGHFNWHMPQKIQLEISVTILPLVFLYSFLLGPKGYLRVAGNRQRLFKTVLAITKNGMSYLSVQLIQGSIVMISTGTSANSHPCNIFKSAGIFAKVGVLILKRSKNLLPLALA